MAKVTAAIDIAITTTSTSEAPPPQFQLKSDFLWVADPRDDRGSDMGVRLRARQGTWSASVKYNVLHTGRRLVASLTAIHANANANADAADVHAFERHGEVVADCGSARVGIFDFERFPARPSADADWDDVTKLPAQVDALTSGPQFGILGVGGVTHDGRRWPAEAGGAWGVVSATEYGDGGAFTLHVAKDADGLAVGCKMVFL
jgi:hypothetical protein